MQFDRTLGALLATALLLNITACSGADADAARADATEANDIIGGKAATQYPEAVLVDIYDGAEPVAACSGSLIAPKVVMTAGHCVHNWHSWRVTAPFAKGQTATVTHGTTYDWKVASETVDPSKHDIGLLFLSTAIELSAYPLIATKPIASGAKVRNIGRIQNGTLSNTELFVSKLIATEPGTEMGFPFDYGATDAIESGDSGGPDVLAGAAPHTIVAVNSGANAQTEVLARVDLVASWIASEVKSAGGSTPSKTPAKAPKSPKSPGSTCTHDPCTSGAHLAASCDPCVAEVCAADDVCCTTTWDEQCASEWSGVCAESCGGN